MQSVFMLCKIELDELKVIVVDIETYRIVNKNIIEALKLDNKIDKKRQEMKYESVMQKEKNEFEKVEKTYH